MGIEPSDQSGIETDAERPPVEGLMRQLSQALACDPEDLHSFDIDAEQFARTIMRLGCDAFLRMEEMTEYDVWATWKQTLMYKIESATGKLTQTENGYRSEVLDSTQSQMDAMIRAMEEGTADDNATAEQLISNVVARQGRILQEADKRASTTIVRPEAYLDEADQKVWHIAQAYLASHEPQPRTLLREKIKCDAAREEMNMLREQFLWDALGAKEKEIAHRVFAEVTKLPYDQDSDRLNELSSYVAGTPSYALKNKKLTCFTGPWMVASLLLEAGIPEEQMYYCNVNEFPTGSAAGHGSLILRCSDKSAIFLDTACRSCSQPFSFSFVENQTEVEKLRKLFNNEKMEDGSSPLPARVRIDRKLAESLHIGNDLHVMPLHRGLAGATLFHAGIALDEANKRDEAKVAYALGIRSYPNSADLLCRQAIIALQEKNTDQAADYLSRSLRSYGGHSLSWYYAGVLALQQGDEDEAYIYFKRVCDDRRASWGDTAYKTHAHTYCFQIESIRRQREKIEALLPPPLEAFIDIEKE